MINDIGHFIEVFFHILALLLDILKLAMVELSTSINHIAMIQDTVYDDFEQGLLLSSEAVIQLPPIRPAVGLLRQVGGIFSS